MVPIVLTGTIIPNSSNVSLNDSSVRRKEYLEAIQYYKQFTKVYFIENSEYDLESDEEFTKDEFFQWYKFPKSNQFEKGKGFQEFEMLDSFVKNYLKEKDFIKISGRYKIENFALMQNQILKSKEPCDAIIDLSIRRKFATTYLFYMNKEFYLNKIYGAYKNMDDSKVLWAEYVIYNLLKDESNIYFFNNLPYHRTTSGSTGEQYLSIKWKTYIKLLERKIASFLKVKKLFL